MRYDAAIIGAGADGLAAAATLAKSGLKVIVLERAEHPGGRCITREFHPGFHASPFQDEIAPIPAEVFWSLGLARHGAVFMPAPVSTALWPDRANTLRRNDAALTESAAVTRNALARTQAEAGPKRKTFFGRSDHASSWPGEALATTSLDDAVFRHSEGADQTAHLMARTLSGRAAQPALAGSALHLLASDSGGLVAGGLQRLTDALVAAAQEAGAEISCGLEATDVSKMFGKVSGVRLADGTEINARAVLSTLDLKRTFLSLFAWNDLPPVVSQRIAAFRMTGSTARLLVALDRLPAAPKFCGRDIFHGPIHLAPSPENLSAAYAAWRTGTLGENLPITLRFTSSFDLAACPIGSAMMTVTVGCVPARLFDGSWTRDRRDALRDRILAVAETAFPGLSARVLAAELIVPPDIEEMLGLTDGDLDGGEIASDQMLSMRPWLEHASPRTPIEGVYLAGGSSSAGALGSCVAGVIAAKAIMADLGRFK